MKKLSKTILLPGALLIYLVGMAVACYPAYEAGEYSAFYYFGVLGASLIVVILLYFALKRKERLKRERIDDMNNQNKK